MHGAAVVIDVPTGEVLALVSAPSYDLNLYDDQYAQLNSPETWTCRCSTAPRRRSASRVRP
jgi:cell division protein FtsI/penicillin-binding protein 2